jgi:hypothetical protein
VAGALFLAALVASCFRGAFPPVDFLAVCFVRAMISSCNIQFKDCAAVQNTLYIPVERTAWVSLIGGIELKSINFIGWRAFHFFLLGK